MFFSNKKTIININVFPKKYDNMTMLEIRNKLRRRSALGYGGRERVNCQVTFRLQTIVGLFRAPSTFDFQRLLLTLTFKRNLNAY